MVKRTKKVKVRLRGAPKKKASINNEVSALGQVLRTLGGLGGGVLGGMLGQSTAGSKLGNGMGASISRWLGAGDYAVSQNSIVTASLKSSAAIPAMHSSGQSITIRHKEYLCAINGSVKFSIQRFFLLQPGDGNTFPWMSGVADRFQQYRVKGMVFHYLPTSGNAVSSTNAALGSVMIQTSYRANDVAPSSKVEMLNEYWACEASPAESFCHPIECAPKENPFQVHYVRNKPVPSNDSPLLYDLGVTYIATQGMQANDNPVGDLWVTYEIELLKPQIASNAVSDILTASIQTGPPTPGAPFGAVLLTSGQGGIAFTVQNRDIIFPIGLLGAYQVVIRIVPSTSFTAFDGSGSPVYSDCTAYSVETGGANYTRSVVSGASASSGGCYYVFGVNCTNPSVAAYVTVAGMSWTGTAAFTSVQVSALS